MMKNYGRTVQQELAKVEILAGDVHGGTPTDLEIIVIRTLLVQESKSRDSPFPAKLQRHYKDLNLEEAQQ
jgi:hypothetical protein